MYCVASARIVQALNRRRQRRRVVRRLIAGRCSRSGEPYVSSIVGAIHSAFSIATASTFAIGIATSLLAAGLVLLFRESAGHRGRGHLVVTGSRTRGTVGSAA